MGATAGFPKRKPSNNSSDNVVLRGGMPPYIEKRSGRGTEMRKDFYIILKAFLKCTV